MRQLSSFSFRQAFTLVELIVVIAILAILWAIGFLSLQNYSANSRDSDRTADVNSLMKSLEAFQIRTSSYPAPDNSFAVTYSGGVVWNQGVFGSGVLAKLSGVGINKVPVDPLNNSNYTYSSLAFGRAFQIETDYEGDVTAYAPSFVETAHAASGNPTVSVIKGTYGGLTAQTQTGGVVYVLAIPSIITNTGSVGQFLEIKNNALSWTLLMHAGSNKTGIAFNPNVVVFSWATLPTNDTGSGMTNMMIALKNAYAGNAALSSVSAIQGLVNTSTGSLATLGASVIKIALQGSATASSGSQGGWTGGTACSPGTYSATWNSPCTTASAGYYVASTGATSQTACSPVTTSPAGSTGSTACTLANLIVPVYSTTYEVQFAKIDLTNLTRTNLATVSSFYMSSNDRFSMILLPDASWVLSSMGSTSNASFNNLARVSASGAVATARYYSNSFNDYWDFNSSLAYDRSTGNMIFATTPHYVSAYNWAYKVQFNPATLGSFSSFAQPSPIYYAAQNGTLTYLYDLLPDGATTNQSANLVNIGSTNQTSYDNNRAFLCSSASNLWWGNATSQIAWNPSRQHYAILSSTEMMINMFWSLNKVTVSGSSISTSNASDLPQVDSNAIAEVSSGVWYLPSTKTFRKNYPNQWWAALDISGNATFDFANTTYYNYFGYGNRFYMIGRTSGGLLRVSIAQINLTTGALISASSNTYGAINGLYQYGQIKNNS